MRHCFRQVATILAAALISISVAASITDLPIKTINGKRYYYYEVQPHETVYALCNRFGISREAMIEANPSVGDGLKAGQTLIFPVEASQPAAAPSTYMVQKDETGYGISRKFNMSLDDFYKLNPSAKDGLKAGQYVMVYQSHSRPGNATQPDAQAASKTATQQRSYTIAAGETLYHISQANGLTLSELLAANPSLNPESYAAGQVIVIPSKAETSGVKQDVADKKISSSNRYEVKEGDTFYGIAHAHGLTVEQLQAANSAIGVLQPGMILDIPQGCDETADNASDVTTPSVLIPGQTVDTMTVAIVMPFTGNDTRASQSIEFLRGFTLAVDSLQGVGTPVRLLVYDTKGTNDDLKELFRSSQIKQANVVVAPNITSQLNVYNRFAQKYNIYLLNLFGIKDDAYKTNPYVLNGNIPTEDMYDKAIDHYMTRYYDVTPVFLKRKNGKDDKDEFVAEFKKKLDSKGIKYHEIEYTDKLSDVTLNKLPGGKSYSFIPNTSNVAELQTFIDAVISYRDSHLDQGSASVWGYPEWLKIRGENLKKLHNANTLIFSRFYSVENDYDEERLEDKYQKWYGVRIADKVPRSGTLGFDTGMFLLKALTANGGDFSKYTPAYEGLQNGYNFEQIPGGGFINKQLFMINFAPGEFITKTGI